jgi:hypothetical protein
MIEVKALSGSRMTSLRRRSKSGNGGARPQVQNGVYFTNQPAVFRRYSRTWHSLRAPYPALCDAFYVNEPLHARCQNGLIPHS